MANNENLGRAIVCEVLFIIISSFCDSKEQGRGYRGVDQGEAPALGSAGYRL